MTHESISLGILTLTATIAAGPIITVRVRSPGGDVGTLHLSIAEWTSLRALVDVLAAADRRHAEDQRTIEAMRACIVYARDRRGGAFDFDTWIRMVEHALEKGGLPPHAIEEAQAEAIIFRDALRRVRDERDQLRAERDVLKQECRELTEQRDAAGADMEAAEQRMLGVLDGTFAVGDGSAQREIERLRVQHGIACNAAEAMTGAFERAQAQLTAALDAKDAACNIAQGAHGSPGPGCATCDRIATLRSIGKDPTNG